MNLILTLRAKKLKKALC